MKIFTVAAAAFAMLAPAVVLAEETNDSFISSSDEFAVSVSDAELEQNRGEGYSFQLSTLTATMDGNTVTGGQTGNNNIDNDSFGNAAGIVSVIQNTGNNALIQSVFTVNVTGF